MTLYFIASAQSIDLVGKGMYAHNVQKLFFDDAKEIDSVLLFVTFKSDSLNKGNIRFRDSDEDVTCEFTPSETKVGDTPDRRSHVGYFSTVFKSVDRRGIYAALTDKSDSKGVQAFYAFVYRSDKKDDNDDSWYNYEYDRHHGDRPHKYEYSVAETRNVFTYHNGASDPVVYNLYVGKTDSLKDIKVEIPLSALNTNADDRVAVIKVTAGDAMDSLVVSDNDNGKFFTVEKLKLMDVSGDIDTVRVEVYSPVMTQDSSKLDGDSFIAGGAVAKMETVPFGECGECKGGITTLDLQYIGEEDSVNINVYSKKGPRQILIASFENVSPGDTLNLTSERCIDAVLGREINIYINDSSETTIHTSCSQPIYVGMSYNNLFLITAGTSRFGGPLCEIPEYPDGECGECLGGITSLDLKYTGKEDSVNLKVYRKIGPRELLIDSFVIVSPGDTISLKGYIFRDGKLTPAIKISINDSSETIINTSCLFPIYIGMSFDDMFVVTYGTSKYGGPLCEYPDNPEGECGECEGGITSLDLQYLGVQDSVNIKIYRRKGHMQILLGSYDNVNSGDTITVTGKYCKQERLGPEIRIFINDSTDYTAIHTSCSQPIYAGMVYDDLFKIIAGTSRYGGPLCELPVEEVCGECDGGLTYLDLQYIGNEDSVNIKLKDANDSLLTEWTDVLKGDTISLSAIAPDSIMLSSLFLYVNDNDHVEINTTCSDSVYVGTEYKDLFRVTKGASLYGGPLCELPVNDQCGECDGGLTSLDLQYLGTEDSVFIKVYRVKEDKEILINRFRCIGPNDTISISSKCIDRLLIPEIRLYINNSENYTMIKTDCSQPVYIGVEYDGLFRVTAGMSKYGGPICEMPPSTPVGSLQDSEKVFDVYPNPLYGSGTIEFKLPEDGPASIELYDITGKKVTVLFEGDVRADTGYSIPVNSGNLNKGLYILVLKNGTKTYKQKLSVIK